MYVWIYLYKYIFIHCLYLSTFLFSPSCLSPLFFLTLLFPLPSLSFFPISFLPSLPLGKYIICVKRTEQVWFRSKSPGFLYLRYPFLNFLCSSIKVRCDSNLQITIKKYVTWSVRSLQLWYKGE